MGSNVIHEFGGIRQGSADDPILHPRRIVTFFWSADCLDTFVYWQQGSNHQHTSRRKDNGLNVIRHEPQTSYRCGNKENVRERPSTSGSTNSMQQWNQ